MNDYYPQLEQIVLANLTSNISDLVEVDRDSLINYNGVFLHAHNCSSTRLILLDEPKYLNWQVRDQAESDFFKSRNSTYLLGSEGGIRQISRHRAMQIWQGYSRDFSQDNRSYIASQETMQYAI
jgi:hypothetical protein